MISILLKRQLINAGKALLVFSLPILVCVAITLYGVVATKTEVIAGAGATLFLYLFYLFVFTDRILNYAKSLQSKYVTSQFSILKGIAFIGKLPIQAGVVIRALLLMASMKLVNVYATLCNKQLQDESKTDDWNFTLLKYLAILMASTYDAIRGKSISQPGIPTRIISVLGIVQFLRSMIILNIALIDKDAIRVTFKLLSNPLWFFDRVLRYRVFILVSEIGLFISIVLFMLLPIFLLSGSISVLRSKTDQADAKNFAIGGILFAIWLLTVPVWYAIEIFLYFQSK